MTSRRDFATPDDGIAAVLKAFKEVKESSLSADRVERRKAAAGKGEVKSSGASRSAQDVWEAYGKGEDIPIEQVLKARKELGIA